jgi:hypothetical protein
MTLSNILIPTPCMGVYTNFGGFISGIELLSDELRVGGPSKAKMYDIFNVVWK